MIGLLPVVSLAVFGAAGAFGASDPANREAQTSQLVTPTASPVDTGFLMPLQNEDINGRMWIGRPIIGGLDIPVRDRRQDGPASYGAYGQGTDSIVVRVPGLFPFQNGQLAEIRPFESVISLPDVGDTTTNPYSTARRKMAARLEDARQSWLKDNNFVGGIRTFVNDATLLKPADGKKTGAAGGLPEPRAVIELAPDMPRFKSRMRVEAQPAPAAAHRSARASGVIKVLPKDPPKEAAVDPKPADPKENNVEANAQTPGGHA